MKQTKWLINLSVLLALLAITVGAKNLSPSRSSFQDAGDVLSDTLTVPDTIALPFASYLMGAVVDSIQLPASDSCVNEYAPLHHFFAGLDSLRAGKDTVITIVQLGDSHIQAGHYSGRMMRLLQQQFGNAGRGWIAPFKRTGRLFHFIRSEGMDCRTLYPEQPEMSDWAGWYRYPVRVAIHQFRYQHST